MTEIELVENDFPQKETPPAKALIKQLQPEKPIDDPQKRARFESEKNQRVAHETQASRIGLTKNKTVRTLTQEEPKRFDEQGDTPEFTRMNFNNPNQARQQESSLSQILPSDIQLSNATNLNTDANIYYSFYSRVEELFYVRWGERLNYYWDRISFDFKKNNLSGKIWSTTLEVLLTPSGEFYSASINKSSGYKPFDEAAVFAFKDARFFPNPPKSKVEADGFVRLRYRLSVHIGSYQ